MSDQLDSGITEAPAAETAADVSADTTGSWRDQARAYFAGIQQDTNENEQVDNQAADDDGDSDAAADAEIADDTAASDTQADESDAADADEADVDDDADNKESAESDDKAEAEDEEGQEIDLMTEAELKAKFPRNSSAELIKTAAVYADAVKERDAIIDTLGGEHFIEPLQKITSALQDPTEVNMGNFYSGIIESAGADTFVKVVETTLGLGFVNAEEWAKHPETAGAAQQLLNTVNKCVQARYGTTDERLAKLAEWDKVGWFDKITEWTSNGYVPVDDLEEMIEINSDPARQKMAAELQEARKQLAALKDREKPIEPATAEIEKNFAAFADEQVVSILSEVAWKTGPLKDAPDDSAAIRDQKAFLRSTLEKDALTEFRKQPLYATLLDHFLHGRSQTAVFRSNFAKALDNTLTATRQRQAIAEQMLGEMRGKTRNAKLTARKSPPAASTGNHTPTQPKAPTTPKDHAANQRELTPEQVEREISKSLRAIGYS